MDSKIIKAFFDGTLSDETIRPPKSREYIKIDARETELYNKLRPILPPSSKSCLTSLWTSTENATEWRMRTTTSAVSSSASALQWSVSTSPTWIMIQPIKRLNP